MEEKYTKGKWITQDTNVYVGDKLMFTCWSERTGHLDDRLEGESWLDMRSRTKDERDRLTKTIPQANALLISKAPEMLEMLDKCKATLSDVFNCDVTEIEQLIKEATTI